LINFSFHYRIKITKIKLSEKNKKELRKLGIEIVYLFGSYAKKWLLKWKGKNYSDEFY